MKKLYLSFVILFVIFSILPTSAQPPDTLWTKILSGQMGKSVFPTSDGEFVIGGYKSVDGFRDFYIAKTDESGNLLWEYTYGFEGISETMNCMIETSDGGYMMAGNTSEDPPSTTYSDNLLVKTDADGLLEWMSVVGANDESDSPNCIAETFEGGFIMTGSIWFDGYNGYDITLTKVNELGAFEWKQHYNFEQGKADYGNWVEVAPDGSYLVTGETQAYNENYDYDAFIMKTSPLGTIESFINIGEDWPMYEGAYRLLQCSDGHLLICGYQNNNNIDNNWYVVKTGEDGWTHTIGGSYHDKAFNACETADGGYAVTGTYYLNDNWNSFIVKYSSDGDTLWTKMWGDPDHSRHNYAIKELDDGGFITVGSITTGPTATGIYLTRLLPGSSSGIETSELNLLEMVNFQPNPFDESTILSFKMLDDSWLAVRVFDITGNLIVTVTEEEVGQGLHSFILDEEFAPGIYFCKIQAGNHTITKKLIRTK
ncbi:MAG: T9SS type A sorting domain-containing protein [Bacteroidetes bacterium]|nr:T9SS type A sorting domain-containing protein [Bacteroidota bacterium]